MDFFWLFFLFNFDCILKWISKKKKGDLPNEIKKMNFSIVWFYFLKETRNEFDFFDLKNSSIAIFNFFDLNFCFPKTPTSYFFESISSNSKFYGKFFIFMKGIWKKKFLKLSKKKKKSEINNEFFLKRYFMRRK